MIHQRGGAPQYGYFPGAYYGKKICCVLYPNCVYLSGRRGVAQPGRVLAWGARGRRFDSCHPDQKIKSAVGRFYFLDCGCGREAAGVRRFDYAVERGPSRLRDGNYIPVYGDQKSNRPWAGFIFWIAGAEEKLRGCAGSTTQWKGAHRVYAMGITFLSTATKKSNRPWAGFIFLLARIGFLLLVCHVTQPTQGEIRDNWYRNRLGRMRQILRLVRVQKTTYIHQKRIGIRRYG